MGIPAMDIAFSRVPIAMIVNPSNEMEFYQIKPHQNSSRFFVIKKYGVFEIDSNTAVRCGKTPVLFYYSEYPKPIHMKYLSMISKWAKRNGVDKVRRKDLRQSGLFDRFSKGNGKDQEHTLQKVKDYEKQSLDSIHQQIQKINEKIISENETRLKQGEPPMPVEPNDYASYIIDSLVSEELISREEAAKLKFQLVKGEVTIDEFISKLEALKTVQIVEPIPLAPRQWLDEFPSYKPSDVMKYIIGTRGLDKRIEKLGVMQIKNLIPAAWIVVIVLAVTMGAAILLNSGVANQITNFFKFG